MVFLREKRGPQDERIHLGVKIRMEPYVGYGERSIAAENTVLRQDYPRRSQLRWVAGGEGAEV